MLVGAGRQFGEDWEFIQKLFYSSSSDRSRAVSRFFCATTRSGL